MQTSENQTLKWKEFLVKNKDELLHRLASYPSGWLFRGHKSSLWMLEPTLERMLKPIGWKSDIASMCETYALHVFRSKAHHYVARDLLPSTKLGWLSLMQHHGVPTRLLDLTESPFIALFFAFDGVLPDQHDPCCIWAIDYRTLMKQSINKLSSENESFSLSYSEVQMRPDEIFDQYVDPGSLDILWITEPRLFNLRLDRQQGSFLLSGNPGSRIQDILAASLQRDSIHKLIVPARLTSEVFRLLKNMGIDNSRLFADLDGFARDIRNEMTNQVPNKWMERKN